MTEGARERTGMRAGGSRLERGLAERAAERERTARRRVPRLLDILATRPSRSE